MHEQKLDFLPKNVLISMMKSPLNKSYQIEKFLVIIEIDSTRQSNDRLIKTQHKPTQETPTVHQGNGHENFSRLITEVQVLISGALY